MSSAWLAGAGASLRAALRLRSRRRLFAICLTVVALVVAGAALAHGIVTNSRAPAAFLSVEPFDADGDGVPDVVENALLGTDPSQPSLPGHLPKAWIHAHRLSVADADLASRSAPYPRPPESPEVYGEGGLPTTFRMTIGEVYAHGRPADWDEARDGAWDSKLDPNAHTLEGWDVPYAWMIHHGLDPLDPSALDQRHGEVAWTPREAYVRGLHPFLLDGDGDGLPDPVELEIGTSPWKYSTTGTGIADGWLVLHGFDPLDTAIAYQDPSNNGLTNLETFEASMRLYGNATLTGSGLNPHKMSTAGGTIPDGWLVHHGLDPLEPGIESKVTQHATVGEDVVHLRVVDEYRVNRPPAWNESRSGPWWGGTDPRQVDSDGDGLTDLEEILGWDIVVNGKTRRVFSDPTKVDTDGDGLTDYEERHGRVGDLVFPPTDPSAVDTDFDGLTDAEELGIVAWHGIYLPQLDPTNPDTAGSGIEDGEEAAYWLSRYERYAVHRLPYEWGPEGTSPCEVFAKPGLTCDEALRELLPSGDLDGDGISNILDPDSDGDGLLDGWEIKPALYRDTPFASDHSRRPTDPANPDTDLDGLPDRWEIEHGVWDPQHGGWNLDPALWSSFHDSVSDAERNLDDDWITWYSFHQTPVGIRVNEHVFEATNLIEYESGSHPNRRSSSPDGIPDSWKIFWGDRYFTLPAGIRGDVYPGSPGDLQIPAGRPVPRIGQDDAHVIDTYAYRRFASHEDLRVLSFEEATPIAFTDSTGKPRDDVFRILGELTLDYRLAVEHMTNPYLDDTDGDGVPDVWEILWWMLGEARDRVSPVRWDAHLDPDGDGLDNFQEWVLGSDPYRRDSDFGGTEDGIEALLNLNLMDPFDDVHALDSTVDSDGDGIPDVAELLGTSGYRTNPDDPDTDRDGLLDGRSLSTVIGRVPRWIDPPDAAMLDAFARDGLIVHRFPDGTAEIYGELDVGSDPTRMSTNGEGIPDGWLVLHNRPPSQTSGLVNAYEHGRPDWWDESVHGVWRWGLAPNEVPTRDHDRDGLDDLNGEDPIPFANARNVLTAGDPREAGIDDRERLRRAQAYGDIWPGPIPVRAEMRVDLDPLPSSLAADGETSFTGNVTTRAGEPARNVTVLLSIGQRALVAGVATTSENGSFTGQIVIGGSVAAPEGSDGIPVFGALSGGVHVNSAELLATIDPTGPVPFFAWTYNTSHLPLPRQSHAYLKPDGSTAFGLLGNQSGDRLANVSLGTSFVLDHPATARAGSTVTMNATLVDALLRPVTHAEVTFWPTNLTLWTDDQGKVTTPWTLEREPGEMEMAWEYAGEGSLLATNTTAHVQIKVETLIDVNGPPAGVRPGETFRLSGRLITAEGIAVNDTRIDIDLDGIGAVAHTSADGTYGATLLVPADAVLGERTVEVRSAGSSIHEAADATARVLIQGNPQWRTSHIESWIGESVRIEATLLDSRGAVMPHRSVEIHSPGGRAQAVTTDAGGALTVTVDGREARPGEIVHRLVFRGGIEGEAAADVMIRYKTKVRIDADAHGLVRGRPTVVEGMLKDAVDRPLQGQPVLIWIGSQTERAVTDHQGRFTATFAFPAALAAGEITLEVRYPGTADGIHDAGSIERKLLLRDQADLRLDDRTIRYGRPLVSGSVVTLFGEPLSGQEVRLAGPWGVIAAQSDRTGRFVAPLPIPESTPLGRLDARLVVAGAMLLDGFDETAIFLLKDEGVLVLDLPAVALQRSEVVANVSAIDSKGRRMAVERLELRVAHEAVDVQLNGDRLSFRLPLNAAKGPADVEVRLISDVLDAPVVRTTLVVREATSIHVESRPKVMSGDSALVAVTLRSQDAVLAGQPLLVYDERAIAVRVFTDEAGVAWVPVTASALRAATYHVVFPGESTYAASAVTLQVPAEIVPVGSNDFVPAWAYLALLPAGLAIYMFVRRKSAAGTMLDRAARRLRKDSADARALYDLYLALLELMALDEEGSETLTFGQIVSQLVETSPQSRADVDLLSEAFDRVVYGGETLDPAFIRASADALGRLADAARPEVE